MNGKRWLHAIFSVELCSCVEQGLNIRSSDNANRDIVDDSKIDYGSPELGDALRRTIENRTDEPDDFQADGNTSDPINDASNEAKNETTNEANSIEANDMYRYTVSAPWLSAYTGNAAGDSPVTVVKKAENNYIGYSGNATTKVMRGSVTWGLNIDKTKVAIGHGDGWDECGAWIQTVIKEGDIIKAFYHGERSCNYDNHQTHKAMGYAESYDGGNTFVKVGYPNNLLIANSDYPQNGKITGEGDARVVRFNGFYYMYFLNASDGWKTGVARSPLSSGGKPGTWRKF